MIETKTLGSVQKAMIAEKSTGDVANDYVGVVSGDFAAFLVKNLAVAPEDRAPTGDF